MVDAEMEAELQGLQAGEERRGSNASQAVDCCMETMVDQFFAMGADQARSKFDALCQVYIPLLLHGGRVATGYGIGSESNGGLGPKSPKRNGKEQMPGKGGGRRNGEDEREQGNASQQLALSASGGCNEGTSANSLELYLPRVRGALGDCEGAGKPGTARDRKRSLSNSPR